MKKALIIIGSTIGALLVGMVILGAIVDTSVENSTPEPVKTQKQILTDSMNDEIEPDVASVRYDQKKNTAVVVIHDGEDYYLCEYAGLVAYDTMRQGITAAQQSKIGLKKLTIIYKIKGTDKLGNDTGWSPAARMTFSKNVISKANTENMTDEMILDAATNGWVLNYDQICA